MPSVFIRIQELKHLGLNFVMKEITSIKMLRTHLLISVLIFPVTINIFVNSVVANDNYSDIIQDLPTKMDFDHYLSALEKIVDFCSTHKHYVDLNLQFGLFLIDGKTVMSINNGLNESGPYCICFSIIVF